MTAKGRGQRILRANATTGGAGPLLSILPGGPAASQIATGSLVTTRGGAVTCTRASSKYCRTGVAFDPTNLAADSENIVLTSAWSAGSGVTTTVSNAGVDPNGFQRASEIDLPAAIGNNAASVRQNVTISVDGTYTFSVYLRTVSGTGSTGVSIGGGSYTACSLTTTWQRFSFSASLTAGTSQVVIGFKVGTIALPVNVYAWGARIALEPSPGAYVSLPLVLLGNNTPAVEPEGLLIEGAATNLLLRSQALATGPWSSGGSSNATNNVAIAPDGTLTASSVTLVSGGTAGSEVWLQNITSMTPSATYTYSMWLWVPSGTATVRLARTNTITWASATVSPTLTLTTTPTRFSLTFTMGGAESSSGLTLGSENKTPFVSSLDTPIYAWGAQVELGTFATSYMPTAGTSASRAADLASIANPLPATSTTLRVSMNVTPSSSRPWVISGYAYNLWATGTTTNAGAVQAQFRTDPAVYGFAYDAGAARRSGAAAAAFADGSTHKIAMSLAGATWAIAFDGIAQSVSNTDVGTGISSQGGSFYIGNYSGGDMGAFALFKDILVYQG